MKRIGSAILIATLMTAISGQAQSVETGGSIFGPQAIRGRLCDHKTHEQGNQPHHSVSVRNGG